MAIRPSRTIQGLKTSAEYDRSAAANTQNVIKSKAQASGGNSRKGGGGLMGAATGALATRDIPMTGDDQGPPMQDKQTPLRATAASPNYTPGSLMDVIAGNRTGEINPNFDSSKAIGGDNVPYKETTGVGGFVSRVLGNKANELNAAAQREQGAEWKADEREAKRLAREDEIEARRAAREDERFNKQQEIIDARRRGDREYQALDNIFEQARRSDEKQQDIALAEQRRRDELAYRKSVDDANAAVAARKLALDEKVANATIAAKTQPQTGYKSLGDGMFEQQSTGQLFRYDPGMPGKEAGMFSKGRAERRAGLVPVNPQTPPPRASANDVPVDPATGQPLQQQTSSSVQSDGSLGTTMVAPQQETSVRISPPKSFEMTDVGPPDLMTQYDMRAKELRAGSRETPETAISPLTRPLYANMAALLNVQPEQVGASRFSNIPEDVVASNPDKYMEMFGKLPEEYQRYAVDDALRKSYEEQEEQNRKDPRKSGWSYK